MRLLPVSLCLFHRSPEPGILEVWVQVRTDDGRFHGLLEFPGGGVEAGEDPLTAVVREVDEEVGIRIDPSVGRFMGTYSSEIPGKTILLYVFLFPPTADLAGRGQWLRVTRENLSREHLGRIPGPNHDIIDDLYRALFP